MDHKMEDCLVEKSADEARAAQAQRLSDANMPAVATSYRFGSESDIRAWAADLAASKFSEAGSIGDADSVIAFAERLFEFVVGVKA